MRSQGLSQSAPQNEPLGKLSSIFPDFTNLTPVAASSTALKHETETDFGIRPSEDGPQENGSEIQDPLSIDSDIKTAVNDLLSIDKEAISAVEDLLGIDKEVVSAVEDLLSMVDTKPNPAILDTSASDNKKLSIQEEPEAKEEEVRTDALPGNVRLLPEEQPDALPGNVRLLPGGNVRLLPEEQLQGNRIVVNSNSFRPMTTQSQVTAVKSQWAQVQGQVLNTQPQTLAQQSERQTSNGQNQTFGHLRQEKATTSGPNLSPGQEAAKMSLHQTWWSEPPTGEKQVKTPMFVLDSCQTSAISILPLDHAAVIILETFPGDAGG